MPSQLSCLLGLCQGRPVFVSILQLVGFPVRKPVHSRADENSTKNGTNPLCLPNRGRIRSPGGGNSRRSGFWLNFKGGSLAADVLE